MATDLDHYNALRAAAEHATHRTGVFVTVAPAQYWVGGRQQTDHYSVTWPGTCQGPAPVKGRSPSKAHLQF
jgi:hypothetical protein